MWNLYSLDRSPLLQGTDPLCGIGFIIPYPVPKSFSDFSYTFHMLPAFFLKLSGHLTALFAIAENHSTRQPQKSQIGKQPDAY
ncbi:hypothetical protein BCR43DRAFT_497246 [Syncephalastrum racemosum]|uniref:Uncharacterized protein n=1 Tax=Syncephalastrum racemosum TaxID=13706 RepID=A0A1X2H5D5_SYNRA|nr:hypothetical protein BCR43DRAFT_497246 [Syncephalastrum racemosum]